jgi:hypothetical protein
MRIGLKTADFYKDNRMFRQDYDYSDIPTLFEMDAVDCGALVEFENNVYSICMVSPKNNFAAAKPVKINDEPEEEINDNIKCPLCGSENIDSWKADEEDENYECGTCGAILEYTSEVSRTFYVNLKERPKIIHAIPGYVGQQPNNTPKPVMAEVNK